MVEAAKEMVTNRREAKAGGKLAEVIDEGRTKTVEGNE